MPNEDTPSIRPEPVLDCQVSVESDTRGGALTVSPEYADGNELGQVLVSIEDWDDIRERQEVNRT